MRKILTRFTIVPITLLVVAALAVGAIFVELAWRDRQAISFASSVVSENSPIAELATRKIVWKVVHIGSTVSTDTVRETVYTIKAGYDLSQAETPVVDKAAKTVTLTLPPPKILSIDHFLQRESFERKTLVERVEHDELTLRGLYHLVRRHRHNPADLFRSFLMRHISSMPSQLKV